MTDIRAELASCREQAAGDLLRRMPRDDLRSLVARCMAIAERCIRDPAEFDAVHRDIRVDGVGAKGRRYVEKDTDAYLLVCRHVFANDRQRGFRYAAVMREAAKRQVGSRDLVTWCAANGGMSALFLSRPLTRKTVETKTIRLTKPIALPKHGSVQITLLRNADGVFAPLEVRAPEGGT